MDHVGAVSPSSYLWSVGLRMIENNEGIVEPRDRIGPSTPPLELEGSLPARSLEIEWNDSPLVFSAGHNIQASGPSKLGIQRGKLEVSIRHSINTRSFKEPAA